MEIEYSVVFLYERFRYPDVRVEQNGGFKLNIGIQISLRQAK